MNIMPVVIDNKNDSKIVYDIFSMLLQNRIIFLNGQINDDKANNVISQLLYLDSINHKDIYLYINSPGGAVNSGFAIYDTMNYIKSNVITVGIGLCASMGAFLLSSGYERYALENCEIMIHEVLGGTQGTATDILNATEHIKFVKNKVNKILAKNTKKSIQTIERDTKKDYYMDAIKAKEYGLIDKILTNGE